MIILMFMMSKENKKTPVTCVSRPLQELQGVFLCVCLWLTVSLCVCPCLSVCLSLTVYFCGCFCLSVSVPVCLFESFCEYFCLSVSVYVCLCLYVSVSLSVHTPPRSLICLAPRWASSVGWAILSVCHVCKLPLITISLRQEHIKCIYFPASSCTKAFYHSIQVEYPLKSWCIVCTRA